MTFSAPAQKLAAYASLSATEVGVMGALSEGRLQSYSRGRDIVLQGQSLKTMFIIVEGWAMRYKTLADGRRQILSFLVAGDVCDPYCFLLHKADHSIGTITDVTTVTVDRGTMEDIVLAHPGLAKAMWVNALVTASIQREWCVSIGQRTAFERLSHLFCEMYSRLEVVGLAQEGRCAFPVNQYDLADATGMTAVHVNRVLQELRNRGLIQLQRPDLFIPDLIRLQTVALFDPLYLHPKPRESDAREAMHEQ
ncbi:cyclic nucleotide-binding protein [Sphingobium sp. SCG-1]|uniref:Crp/Fnr family transcriptional regulator n=1 Tax=Sphingobium sp. SCG-1 TaxID=2072936 RepID=UPI000CD68731|nr:Crp/Fnr family transcriptional regulator [Sphingobium sp. SCG-1]AUW57314.1 cyclic nucleotide-binding protein [Sphingobium sp. SCG-1]